MRKKVKVSAIRHARKSSTKKPKISSRMLAWLAGGVAALGVLFLARTYVVLILLQILQFIFTPILPSVIDNEALFANQSTIIYDRDGNELYTIHGEENRFEIPYEKMPDAIKFATIAAEDDQFFNHPGFDVDGIARAILGELGLPFVGGGSTITQQFVKNTYLSPEKTYWRKLKELMMSLKVENNFSKEEILAMYLNKIPYGSNAYGIQAAAQTFFAKNAEELTLAESAVLAGLPQAPTRYSPYGENRDLLLGRCGDESGVNAAAVEEFTITPTGKVWLSVAADGEEIREWTARAGESVSFPFENKFTIQSGNDNFVLTVGETEIPTSGQRTFTATRASLDLPAAAVSERKVCESINDPDYHPGRKDYVLRRMLELGFIDNDEFEEAWTEANNLKFGRYREEILAPHFVFYVKQILEETYGKDLVERGGLRVFTTLDSDLQKVAEKIAADAFPHTENSDGTISWSHNSYGATNASSLAIDNQTGQILSMVGSRDYFETLQEDGYGNDGATNLTTRLRQPGSSFKPIVYAAGLAAGWTPATVFWDVETNFGGVYEPQNYDGTFLGPLTMRRALDYSRNVPAVKMAILVGEKAVVALAEKMGIDSLFDDERYGPAIGLGAGEVSMMEMVRAYSTFANAGKLISPTPFLKITDSKGNLIDEFEEVDFDDLPTAMEPEIAFLATDILSDASSRPAGWNGYLDLPGRPNGAKTGTANKRISEDEIRPGDVWTIGFTPQITAAAWMGNNDGTPMNFNATGLTNAAPMWRKLMIAAHENLPVERFTQPEDIVLRPVSKLTGKVPSTTTPEDEIVIEKFAKWATPMEVDDAFVTLEIDRVSGKLPTEYTPSAALEEKTFVNLHSLRPRNPEWEEPVQDWLAANSEKEGVVYEAPPREFDDVHTATTVKQKPSVTIVSPTSGSTVRTHGIGVWVDVLAPHGTEKVEYFLDGELVSTATADPWKGAFAIPARTPDGTRLTISAKIYDKLFYTDTSSVEVVVGEDTQAPTVRFTSPTAEQQVPRGSVLVVAADAFDAGGDVAKIDFYLDGQLVESFTKIPYEFQLPIRDSLSLGSHRISATARDTDGQTSSGDVIFEIVAGSGAATDFSILQPADGYEIPAGETSIAVVGQIDTSKFAPTVVEFISRNLTTGSREIFATVENPKSEVFSAVWTDFTPGEYDVYLKARDDAGGSLTSGHRKIVVSE